MEEEVEVTGEQLELRDLEDQKVNQAYPACRAWMVEMVFLVSLDLMEYMGAMVWMEFQA